MKKIDLLCAEQDREALQPVLEQLKNKGFRVKETNSPKKDGMILAVLSESFYADAGKTGALLDLIGSGAENLIPLNIDGSVIPANIMNTLYSRNIIMAEGREAEHIAERIVSAVPVKKSRLPLILSIAGVVLVAVIGLIIWRSMQPGTPEPEATPEPTPLLYDLPEGLTAEDLEKVVDVLIIGEKTYFLKKEDVQNGPYPDWNTLSSREFDGEAHWYSYEDGQELAFTRYDDLRFLELLPNLNVINFANIEADQLPKLANLKKLTRICVMDCSVPDLEWVRGSSITHIDFINSRSSVYDLSPLTDCKRLRSVHIDIVNNRNVDLRGFAPPELDWLWINNGQHLEHELDLSGLRACTKLRECELEFLPIKDISFLSGATKLELLKLYDDKAAWGRISVRNTACSGFFSSDRSIGEYAAEIWHLEQDA